MAKVNVYIPDDLLERVDTDAQTKDASRSAVVQEALTQYLTTKEAADSANDAREAGLRALAQMERLAGQWAADEPASDYTAVDTLREIRNGAHD